MEILKTNRLVLRAWRLSDSKDLFEYASSDLVGPNAGWPPHKSECYSREIIKSFIYEDYMYAIEHISDKKVIGAIGLDERKLYCYDSQDQREIGFVLNPKYWGQGLIAEAARELMVHAFDSLNTHMIWCCHYDFNHNSKRLIEKLGFQHTMEKEEILSLLDNKKVQSHIYTMKRDSFDKIRELKY